MNPAHESPPFEAIALECIRGERMLFSALNLSLHPGRLVQVDGANGSGKTSLLRILCGLALPSAGEVLWQGQPISRIRDVFMAEIVYIGHKHGVKDDLTPVENLRIARGLARPVATASIHDALDRVGLTEFTHAPARTLSAGQRRRVALSRLLATQARLWVLDEPLAALDTMGVALVQEILSEHLHEGGMAIITTHQPLSIRQGETVRLSLN